MTTHKFIIGDECGNFILKNEIMNVYFLRVDEDNELCLCVKKQGDRSFSVIAYINEDGYLIIQPRLPGEYLLPLDEMGRIRRINSDG